MRGFLRLGRLPINRGTARTAPLTPVGVSLAAARARAAISFPTLAASPSFLTGNASAFSSVCQARSASVFVASACGLSASSSSTDFQNAASRVAGASCAVTLPSSFAGWSQPRARKASARA